jgi:hypothetical protein
MARGSAARAAIVLLLGLSSGCASASATVPAGTPAGITVPLQSPWDTDPPTCPVAFARGRLVSDANWGIAFVRDDTSVTTKVLWPSGYSARPGSPAEVLDETGRVVARVGDTVMLPGGGVVDGEWWVCPGIEPTPASS